MMPMKKRVMGIKAETFIAQTEEAQAGNVLKGVPTSGGKVTAPACVLRGPEDFARMRPGAVLVAGTTTPAWTPLFAMASAVVTDIGGPLSHGSIVAREYGIPAVMGTGIATRRIQSGQAITVDGTKGEVILETTEGDQSSQSAAPIEWTRPNPKAMYARASLAEHLPNAVSPLFATLGLRAVNKATAELEDLMKINLVENEYQYRAINGYVYMGILLTAKFTWAMMRITISGMKFMLQGGTERWLEARKILADVIAKWDRKNPEEFSPIEILECARELMYSAGKYYTVIQSGTLPSASSSEIIFTRVYKMVSRADDPIAETLLFGLETLPLRAEKSQFDLGMWIRERPALRDFALHTSTEELVAALGADSPPGAIPAADWDEFKSRFEKHLEEFGHTAYEFDFMNPTPAETPELILDAVKMYVEGKGSDPYARQREAAERREQTVQKIRGRFKLIPNRWFDKALQWAMDTGPAREDSLADMGMGHTTIRRLLSELGKRFVVNGALENAEDIYWLVEDEVDGLASMLERGETLPEYSRKVSARKSEWRIQMKLTPPPMLPENSRWAKLVPGGRGDVSGNIIKGLGSSPGKVTATARLLFSPEDFGRMKQGDVLVAVTTTPAWTPLFTLASAVVTDIGGPLSHSSIVAREYGIPAVLATGNATRHIQDGQTIIVDGGAGTVTLGPK
jgi:pyruvate,water dikinase